MLGVGQEGCGRAVEKLLFARISPVSLHNDSRYRHTSITPSSALLNDFTKFDVLDGVGSRLDIGELGFALTMFLFSFYQIPSRP